VVRLWVATYVYISYRFKTPYNANKRIFVYPHGFFYIYIYICCHGYIINNNNYHGFFICIYIYIFTYVHHFYMYIHIYIFRYIYLFFYIILLLTAQVVLNAFSIGCHTLHTRPFHGLLFVIHLCVLINRRNSIYLYRMFSIWLHTIGIYKIVLWCRQLSTTIIITIVLYKTLDKRLYLWYLYISIN